MANDNFTDIPFTTANLDRFIVRDGIFRALQQQLPQLRGRLIDIGCGKMPYRSYILSNSAVTEYAGLDIESALVYDEGVKPDFTWDGITMPMPNEQYDCAFATEVLEHCPDPLLVLRETNRVLKPGGAFFFTVPFLWNLHEVPYDEYRYTPFALQRLLTAAGFHEIQLQATGGWHRSMAQMLGLWVRRSPLGSGKRKLFSTLLKPVIAYLLKKDTTLPVTFKEGQMITGLSGIAYKK